MNQMLINALRKATTQEDVEDLFNRFCITDIMEKTNYLDKAMRADEVFYSGIGDENDDYNITLAMFLNGQWRICELYERLSFEE